MSIKVGEATTSQVFNVHEDVIKERSKPLKQALERQWVEGQPRELHMPDVRPDVLEGYVDWMYGSDTIGTQYKELSIEQDVHAAYLLLARLYVFGEDMEDPKFCNAVMENMTKLCDTRTGIFAVRPSNEAIKVIYEGTPSGSPARAFLIAFVQQNGHQEWFSKNPATYNVEYLLDVAGSLVQEKVRGRGSRPMFEQRQKWMKEE